MTSLPWRGIAVSAVVALTAMLSPLIAAAASPVTRDSNQWVWPLDPAPTVVRGFEPPSSAWSAGHRGVDLAGRLAQPVETIGPGMVTFAGTIAGRGVVVVDHGALRSTYEPVTAAVHVGDAVVAGQLLGLLQGVGSHCTPDACLHLGVKDGSHYIDPLSLFGPRPVRLKPLDAGAADVSSWPPGAGLGGHMLLPPV